jgi:hypothetical protein
MIVGSRERLALSVSKADVPEDEYLALYFRIMFIL